jgi:hypothetical protein
MNNLILWSEYKKWTRSDVDDDLRMNEILMRDLAKHPKVQGFLEVFIEYVTYNRVSEVSRHVDDPKRQSRSYCEALRDIGNKLLDIKDFKDKESLKIRRSA